MKTPKVLLPVVLLILVLTGCDLSKSPDVGLGNVNAGKKIPAVILQSGAYDFYTTGDGKISQIKNRESNEVYIADVSALCGQETMLFSQPENSSVVILQSWNPGSGITSQRLRRLDLAKKECRQLQSFPQVSGFGDLQLSPDKAKLAFVFEINGARELNILDLINDKILKTITLNQNETFNAGYGAHSNHFEIKWLDDQKIQYAVFQESAQNYGDYPPSELKLKIREGVVEMK